LGLGKGMVYFESIPAVMMIHKQPRAANYSRQNDEQGPLPEK